MNADHIVRLFTLYRATLPAPLTAPRPRAVLHLQRLLAVPPVRPDAGRSAAVVRAGSCSASGATACTSRDGADATGCSADAARAARPGTGSSADEDHRAGAGAQRSVGAAALAGVPVGVLRRDPRQRPELRGRDPRRSAGRFPKVVVLDADPDEPDPRAARGSCSTRRATTTATTCCGPPTPTSWCRRAPAAAFLRDARGIALTPGTVDRLPLLHLWNDAGRYRDDLSYYAPQWKQIAFVDDRRIGLRPLASPRRSTSRGCRPPARRAGRQGRVATAAASAVADPGPQPAEAGVVSLPRVARRRQDARRRSTRATRRRSPTRARGRPPVPPEWIADAHVPGRGSAIARPRGTSARSSPGSTSTASNTSSRWRSGTFPCCATSSAAASGGRRSRIARTCRRGRHARGNSGGGVAARRAGGACPSDMARPFLTVLTAPVPGAGRRLIAERAAARAPDRQARRAAAQRRRRIPATTRSSAASSKASAPSTPTSTSTRARMRDVARVVYAPANEALRQAAALKREGRIDYLVAGPVNALFADEADGILLLPEIDRLIVAHEWQTDFVRGFPEVRAKCRACPCGVDTDWWKPSGSPQDAAPPSSTGRAATRRSASRWSRSCAPAGWSRCACDRCHGEHAIFQPDRLPARCSIESAIGVFLSTFETQGLALAEAWSMDVPTVVWDPQGDGAVAGPAVSCRGRRRRI